MFLLIFFFIFLLISCSDTILLDPYKRKQKTLHFAQIVRRLLIYHLSYNILLSKNRPFYVNLVLKFTKMILLLCSLYLKTKNSKKKERRQRRKNRRRRKKKKRKWKRKKTRETRKKEKNEKKKKEDKKTKKRKEYSQVNIPLVAELVRCFSLWPLLQLAIDQVLFLHSTFQNIIQAHLPTQTLHHLLLLLLQRVTLVRSEQHSQTQRHQSLQLTTRYRH